LPSDLPAAIKHLDDHELEQLQAAVTAEQQRRGKITPASKKTLSKRVEAAAVSLTPGKLNAVLAAFKAGVTPARIAREFGIPQSDVRKVIAGLSEKEKP
jgi:DNA-directed RNA polymerase specialized sigma24 family protein